MVFIGLVEHHRNPGKITLIKRVQFSGEGLVREAVITSQTIRTFLFIL